MELKQALYERRSVRHFSEKPVQREILQEITESAIQAPTAGNIQPWAFICISDPEMIHKIQVISPGMLGNPQAVICVCSDQKRAQEKAGKGGGLFSIMDCSMAAQNMMLRAYDLGLGTCAVRSFNQIAARELIDAPEHLRPELLITVGYPATKPKKPQRRKEVIFWEKYFDEKDSREE
jgi:nitroreductase